MPIGQKAKRGQQKKEMEGKELERKGEAEQAVCGPRLGLS